MFLLLMAHLWYLLACVNPSLTYMAMTARAADHAVSELKKQNL